MLLLRVLWPTRDHEPLIADLGVVLPHLRSLADCPPEFPSGISLEELTSSLEEDIPSSLQAHLRDLLEEWFGIYRRECLAEVGSLSLSLPLPPFLVCLPPFF